MDIGKYRAASCITRSASTRYGKVMGSSLGLDKPRTLCSALNFDALTRPWCSMVGPNHVLAKDLNICTCYCYVRFTVLIVRVGRRPWPKNRRNYYHAKLGYSDKGRAIKGLYAI